MPGVRPTASPPPERRPWPPWRPKIVWGLAAGAVAVRILGVPGFRGRSAGIRVVIMAFNRRWANPMMLQIAGGSPWGISRLELRGRSSGKLYATPVWADPVSEGFLIPMPYGTDVDWARNLSQAGQGVLQHKAVRYRVGNPRIVPAAAALPELPMLIRRLAGPYGIRDFMRVDVLPSLTAAAPPPV